MTNRTVALDDLRDRRIEDVLREVVEQQEELTVQLPDGEDIQIRPVPRLKPLPKLRCIVPRDWKDAING